LKPIHVGFVYAVLAVPSAFAVRPPMPHPATNPSCAMAPTPGVPFSTVVGTSWVFHEDGTDEEVAAVGTIRFSQVADPNSQSGVKGVLKVTDSLDIFSYIDRFDKHDGNFTIFPDCTGGTLRLNDFGIGVEFDFYFRELNGDPFGSLVGVVNTSGNQVSTIEAEKQGSSLASCALAPTPGVPFSTVVGTSWVFHSRSTAAPIAQVGNMSFIQVADPNSQSGEAGFINLIQTLNIEGNITRFLNTVGRFEIFPDCTGGTLMFTGTNPSIEYDFYFRNRNGDPFGSMVYVSIDSFVEVSVGEAEKQGPS